MMQHHGKESDEGRGTLVEDTGFQVFLGNQQAYLENLRIRGYDSKVIESAKDMLNSFTDFLKDTRRFSSAEIYSNSGVDEFAEWLRHRRKLKREPLESRRRAIGVPVRAFLKWYGYTYEYYGKPLRRFGKSKIKRLSKQFVDEKYDCYWGNWGTPQDARSRIVGFFSYLERHQITDMRSLSYEIFDRFSAEIEQQILAVQKPNAKYFVQDIHSGLCKYFAYLASRGLIRYQPDIKIKQRPEHFISGVITLYLDFCQEAKGLSPITLKNDRGTLDLFALHLQEIGQTQLGTLQSHHVESFISTRKCTRRTISRIYSTLRNFLKYLYVEKLISTNIALRLTSPRIFRLEEIPRYLTQEELRKLFENKTSPLSREELCTRAIVYVMLFIGLRTGEVAHLTLDDINWDKKQILIRDRKNRRDLLQVVPDPVIQALYEYVSQARPNECPERSIFFTMFVPRLPMTSITVRDAVLRHFESRGIEGGGHRLRHTHAQLLLETGSSLDQVQASLGHDVEDSTRVYAKTSMRRMRRFVVGEEP